MFGFTLAGDENFEQVGDNQYKMTDAYDNQIFSKEINLYTNWNEALDVYIFNDPDQTSSGLFLGTGETPRHAIPWLRAASHANAELASLAVGYANTGLASLAVDITTLVSKTLPDRMASVKGRFGTYLSISSTNRPTKQKSRDSAIIIAQGAFPWVLTTFGLPSNEAVASDCFRMIWLSQLAFKDNLSFLSAYSGLKTSFSMLIPTMVARK
jgi:hypothetical protein